MISDDLLNNQISDLNANIFKLDLQKSEEIKTNLKIDRIIPDMDNKINIISLYNQYIYDICKDLENSEYLFFNLYL
jgi:hypothetical protein